MQACEEKNLNKIFRKTDRIPDLPHRRGPVRDNAQPREHRRPPRRRPLAGFVDQHPTQSSGVPHATAAQGSAEKGTTVIRTDSYSTPIPLDADDARDLVRLLKPGSRLISAEVERVVLNHGDNRIVAKRTALVEITVENDPESNCVGATAEWWPVGEQAVRFVGNWGELTEYIDHQSLASVPWVSEADMAEAARDVIDGLLQVDSD